MAVEDLVRTGLGIAGNLTSIGLFVAPAQTFYKIFKWKDTKGFSGIPYAITILNCALWVLYGLPIVKKDSILVATVNGIGLVLEIIYTTIFLIYCPKRKERLKILALVAAFVASFALLASLTLSMTKTHDDRVTIIGTVSIVFSILMYASPLSIMFEVIRTKSVKYVPVTLAIVCTCNGFVWTAYGCIHFDRNLVIPNGVGSLLGCLQLLLYCIYYKSTNWDDKPAGTELDAKRPNTPKTLPHDIP